MITITDGGISTKEEEKQFFNSFRERENVHHKAIVIGRHRRWIEDLCDEIYEIDELKLSADGIAQCLSI